MTAGPPLPPLAKPSGVVLDDHNRHVQEQADAYFEARPFVAEKYRRITGGHDLPDLVRVSIRWHDQGKRHPIWQRACRLDHEECQRTGRCGNHLRDARLRHEIASLVFLRGSGEPTIECVRAAIGAHHGKLSQRHKDRWSDCPEFEPHWREFARIAAAISIGDAEEFDQAILRRYEFAGPRALLQLADHRASALEEPPHEPLPPFETFSYIFPHAKPRGVQKLVESLWDEPFAILRAPTGSGKTDACLLWAQRQIVTTRRADRLVIAMPTRFTANALAISTAEDLSANGLYHSSAWYQRLTDKSNPTPAEKRYIDWEQGLARLLETPVTVTTLDHLCISLTGTREDHHGIFFGLAHSCVVIDEADFYDPFTQANLVVLLRALRLLDVPVLLMSATVPESARELYSRSGFAPARIHQDTTDSDRIRCLVTRHGTAETPADVAGLLLRALDGEPMIIYANTVARAQAYYDWFAARDACDNVVLYHSRFTEPDKATIESRLRQMLGAEAWERGEARGVAILTQIGELSVNISADLMITDLCPLDRLVQRIGRLSRFWRNGVNCIGELHLVLPYRKDKSGNSRFYPAPYGTYKPGTGWIPNSALTTSDTLLVEGTYTPAQLVKLVDELYPDVPIEASDVRVNRRALEDCVALNWLLLPAERPDDDEDHTKDWRCRDIPPQITVYADYEGSQFDSDASQAFRYRSRWRQFQLRHGIQMYAYEVEAAVKNTWLERTTFTIGDEDRRQDEEVAWLVRAQFYDHRRGLRFPG